MPARRINVSSGRTLEQVAQYSRALRVGDTVLQAGTTAIDRAGHVRGTGDVARQVETILAIAEWSMGKAGGRLDDVVRSRIYVTDIAVADQKEAREDQDPSRVDRREERATPQPIGQISEQHGSTDR